MSDTQTNSSLATFRECPRKYDLTYNLLLEPDREGEREPLAVGTAWHVGMEHRESPERYSRLRAAAPTELWAEKLSVLAAAHDWYWQSQPIEFMQHEFTFEVELDGIVLRGQIDGIVTTPDGRTGLIEFKTTGDSLDGSYFDRLRLDTQVGLYALATQSLGLFSGRRPDFILYDVVRKPTINPKGIAKKDVTWMRRQLDDGDRCTYYGLEFGEMLPGGVDDVLQALDNARECPRLYAARLRADIGERPEYYFARREVHRTADDYAALLEDIRAQLRMLHDIECLEPGDERPFYPRNPNACTMYGTCELFGICSHNAYPKPGDPPPQGFRVRAHRHPELDGKPKASE